MSNGSGLPPFSSLGSGSDPAQRQQQSTGFPGPLQIPHGASRHGPFAASRPLGAQPMFRPSPGQALGSRSQASRDQAQEQVELYRRGRISKQEAQLAIENVIRRGCIDAGISYSNDFLQPFVEQLNSHEQDLRRAQETGNQRFQGPTNQTSNCAPPEPNLGGGSGRRSRLPPSRSQSESRRIRDGKRKQRDCGGHHHHHRRNRHGGRSPSPSSSGSSSSSSSSSSDSDHRSKKKLKSSLLHFEKETAQRQVALTDRHRKVAEQLENFSRDKKEALRCLFAQSGLPKFTEDGWKAILKGDYVNLGKVNKELHFRDEEVKNQTHWSQCWDDYSAAMQFAFGGRDGELASYRKYIIGKFTNISNNLHHNVIAFDQAA
ncbi:hypothetical protein PM082_023729 [Marasmius tenuissimus]|nr:hypothetical protein PM082_023729 [Marasmius tenuissimus]